MLAGFILYNCDSISYMLDIEKLGKLSHIIKTTDEILSSLDGISDFRSNFNVFAETTSEGWGKLVGKYGLFCFSRD